MMKDGCKTRNGVHLGSDADLTGGVKEEEAGALEIKLYKKRVKNE